MVAASRAEADEGGILGGSRIHASNGAVDDEVASEQEAFERARRYLSYLPSSVHEFPPRLARPATTRRAARIPGVRRARATAARSTRCGRSSRRWSTTGSFFEIGAACMAAPWSPDWPGSTAGQSPCSRAIRTYGGCWTADELGEGRAVRRFRADVPPAGGAPRRQPGFHDRQAGRSRSHHPRGRTRTDRGLPGDRPLVHGDHPQGVRRRRRRATRTTRVSTTAMRGLRRTGARCRSKAGSKRPTKPNWMRQTIAPHWQPRSRNDSTGCVLRSGRRRNSRSRKSSTHATRASCSANSPILPRRCARRDRWSSRTGLERRPQAG